jgi:capsular polysaccharide biosynthesis protein/Mrp family chromosome partitioning ATPase
MTELTERGLSRPELGLGHYWYVVSRQWRVVVAGAALGLLVAGAVLLVLPSKYTATTDVRLNVISSTPFDSAHAASTLLDDSTETQIAGSYAVARAASAALHGSLTASALREGSTITASTGATIVHVQFTSASTSKAVKGADALATAYLDYRSTAAKKQISAIVDSVNKSLADLQAKLADANGRVAASPANSTAGVQAATDREVIVAEISTVSTQKSGLQQIDTSGGSLLTSAEQNDVTHSPSALLTLLGGLLAGAVVGVIAAFIVNVFDRRIRSPREVEYRLGVPVLGDIDDTAATIPADGAARGAFRRIRERLLTELDPSVRSIAIIDDTGAEPRSDVAANLAVVLTRAGTLATLVVVGTTDDERAMLRDRLGLVAHASERTAVPHRSSEISGLLVALPIEAEGDYASVSTKAISKLTSTAAEYHVIISLPSDADEASRRSVARSVDAAIIVIATNSSRSDQIEQIITELAATGTQLLGAIVVPAGRTLAGTDTDAVADPDVTAAAGH